MEFRRVLFRSGLDGAMRRAITEPLYIDLHFEGAGTFAQALPASFNAFVYVYRGELQIGDQALGTQRMAILKNEGDGGVIESSGPDRALLIAGQIGRASCRESVYQDV